MKLIVGLGNPGGEYQNTRHNIGFMVLEKISKELTMEAISWQNDPKHRALIAKIGDLLLVKPQTFMNKSGDCVKSIMDFYKLEPSDIWVIHDDIDLPLGKIRIREQGASGGHNGVDSIITAVGSDKFIRFRLGIGRGKEGVESNVDRNMRHRTVISFVLSKFNVGEAGAFKHLIKHGTEAVQMALNDGIDKAMNRYN
jgi:peptidyl-tRNA hydrolase, PTH1 family